MSLLDHILLLHKKLTGKLDLSDKQLLDRWLNKPGGQAFADEIERIWDLSRDYKSSYEPDVEAGLSQLKKRIAADLIKGEPPPSITITRPATRWWRVAAAILLLAVSALAVRYFLNRELPLQEYATLAAEQETVNLPDGSTIILNENSKLAFRKDLFERGARILELSGEAYFNLQPEPENGFLVRTPEAEVRVLGTSFNVREFQGEGFTEVEVERGTVSFRLIGSPDSLILKARQKGILRHSGEMTTSEAPHLNGHSWRTGRLKFFNTPVNQVLAAVERHFKIDIRLNAPQIDDCLFSTNFEKSGLFDVLGSLEKGLNVKIKESGPGKFILSGGNNCR